MFNIHHSPLLPLMILVVFCLIKSNVGYTIHFQNSCSYKIWAAVGKAPNGQPDPSVSFGQGLEPGEGTDFGVADNQLGIRAWGRTGCDG